MRPSQATRLIKLTFPDVDFPGQAQKRHDGSRNFIGVGMMPGSDGKSGLLAKLSNGNPSRFARGSMALRMVCEREPIFGNPSIRLAESRPIDLGSIDLPGLREPLGRRGQMAVVDLYELLPGQPLAEATLYSGNQHQLTKMLGLEVHGEGMEVGEASRGMVIDHRNLYINRLQAADIEMSIAERRRVEAEKKGCAHFPLGSHLLRAIRQEIIAQLESVSPTSLAYVVHGKANLWNVVKTDNGPAQIEPGQKGWSIALCDWDEAGLSYYPQVDITRNTFSFASLRSALDVYHRSRAEVGLPDISGEVNLATCIPFALTRAFVRYALKHSHDLLECRRKHGHLVHNYGPAYVNWKIMRDFIVRHTIGMP